MKYSADFPTKASVDSMRRMIIWLLFFSLSTASIFSYEVEFKGVDDAELLELLQSISQLKKLKGSPPATMLGLKRRGEGDIENILQGLHSQGYYGARAELEFNEDRSQVIVDVTLGPIYPFEAFTINYLQNGEESCESNLPSPILLEDLKVKIGAPALPEVILTAEDTLLDKLNLQGFAFASIKKREVFADQKTHAVTVIIVVDTGPLTYFGNLTITGLERVKESFFYRKLRWDRGDLYNPVAIEKTQEALELSGLFRSVNISHGEAVDDDDDVPMEISVVEAKQRSVGFGLNYTTSLGPGFTAEWEDRNIFGKGQKLGFRSNIWAKLQEGALSYVIPDFWRQDQNLIWLVEYQRERTKSFTENSLSFSGSIEKKVNETLRFSYGAMYKRLRSQRSDFNGIFDLLKTPLQLRWSNTDSILDPTQGATILIRSIPSLQMFKPQFAYCINTFTGSIYQPLTEDKRHVFAAKVMLGSIFGANKHEIPPPERLYAGSESTLRGYRFLTVSPLNPHDHDKPIGGRSMLIYTMELRSRIGKNFGLVLFYDVGNVYTEAIPNLREGMLQSTGIGFRYYTPIGPLRLDVAFPLNKRHLDNSLEIYFSIGQSF